jgi:serine/threonine protein kinase
LAAYLTTMHELKYIHMDIKLENLFLYRDAFGEPILKFGDYGSSI